MAANHTFSLTNLDRARQAWGEDMPPWVRLLGSACDSANQRQVGQRLGRSSGWVSRVLNATYGGSYEEAETLILAAYGNEGVVCPVFGAIPLSSCVRARRRKAPPQNQSHRWLAAACPICPNNSDRAHAAEEE
jgi:hypothetical protein